MSSFYLDSSALAKRYLVETGTPWVLALTDPPAGHAIFLAEITWVEVAAALATSTVHLAASLAASAIPPSPCCHSTARPTTGSSPSTVRSSTGRCA